MRMTSDVESLRKFIIKSYWGTATRFSSLDEGPLWEKIEIYMLALLLNDYSFDSGTLLWLNNSDSLKIARTRTVIKLEKALDKLVEYLRVLKADPEDIARVIECRDNIVVESLSEKVEKGGSKSGDTEGERTLLEETIKECYEIVKLVECKYFSRNVERCMSRYFSKKRL